VLSVNAKFKGFLRNGQLVENYALLIFGETSCENKYCHMTGLINDRSYNHLVMLKQRNGNRHK